MSMATPSPSRGSGPLKALYEVPAPAKLNLFLHITGQRSDGYHLLQSVFMLIDWCDRLSFDVRSDGLVSREDLTPGDLPEEDLCIRAARLLQKATGCDQGVHIGLEKHLPAEAGLGGGSSDAATCLLALNRLWALGLSRQQLAVIGLQLGADVPFFVGGHNAWIEGIGEQLTPISLPSAQFVVVKPPGGASTQRIFTSPELKRNTKTATIQGFAANGSSGTPMVDIQAILDAGHNDLQPVAQSLCPDIDRCLGWLRGQGLQGRMTGSGTAVFAHMRQPVDLSEAPQGWKVQECSNMDVHPLLDWCTD
jgi:4-diphosphocytidyl-2-C-methyl-D-erythritol kinase